MFTGHWQADNRVFVFSKTWDMFPFIHLDAFLKNTFSAVEKKLTGCEWKLSKEQEERTKKIKRHKTSISMDVVWGWKIIRQIDQTKGMASIRHFNIIQWVLVLKEQIAKSEKAEWERERTRHRMRWQERRWQERRWEERKWNERGTDDKRWKKREGKMDGISNQCKSVPPTVITLVCVATHTHTYTPERTRCKSFLPMLIKPMRKSTLGMRWFSRRLFYDCLVSPDRVRQAVLCVCINQGVR